MKEVDFISEIKRKLDNIGFIVTSDEGLPETVETRLRLQSCIYDITMIENNTRRLLRALQRRLQPK